MTPTELVSRDQTPEAEQIPQLAVVPAVTGSDVPGGNSAEVPPASQAPTRETCARARARPSVIRAVTSRDRWGRFGRFLTSTLAPPDIVRQQRPSLREAFNHARWGTHHPAEGPARAVSIVAALVLLPFVAAGYLWSWVFERPARVIFVGSLALVGSRIPGVDTALDVLVTVFTAPISWL